PQEGAKAQDIRFLRIGAGPTSGTSFSIAGLIANAISNPPGSRPCEKGGSCGVPGVIAVAQSTQGSSESLRSVARGGLDAALAQGDTLIAAVNGQGDFAGKAALKNLRAIGVLYPATVHVVVRKDSRIKTLRDLRGKRVSLGEKTSDAFANARRILAAFNIPLDQMAVYNLTANAAADLMAAGKLDAFFAVDGAPAVTIQDLAERVGIALLPLNGPPALKLADKTFLDSAEIPADTYKGVAATATLQTGIVLVVNAAMPDDLALGLTRALWHKNTAKLLANGHPVAKRITLETALSGLGNNIPLHPGAAAFYAEADVTR
ncbi:MAG: hypothetical protein A2516_00010, partial [Alphaproteobacteria bacterium RIFOXYD12_FULL_60_8]